MSGKYKPYIAVFPSGERFPVLLYQATYQPVILPTRYIISERRESKQAGTIMRDLRVLHWFYDWCAHSGIDIEARLREGKLPSTEEVTGFCRYLRARRSLEVIGSIGPADSETIAILTPQTFNAYTGVLRDFLLWAADQFIPDVTPDKQIQQAIDTATRRLRRAFRSNRKGGSAQQRGYALSYEEMVELREVVQPGSKRNPFKGSVQFRNYLIIELMLATGIRRGELLKIKLRHLPQGPQTTLSIVRAPDDPEDTRRREPQVKTHERQIPIPSPLRVSLWKYVQNYRKRGSHTYLFTSHRGGVPLDAAGVNRIFDLLVKRCLPHLKGRLHPHALRHTFNGMFLEQALALGWDEGKRNQVQRYLNGWSEQSKMPERYTRRIIETQAMEIAEKFQARLYAD